jgi:hypothetical protein
MILFRTQVQKHSFPVSDEKKFVRSYAMERDRYRARTFARPHRGCVYLTNMNNDVFELSGSYAGITLAPYTMMPEIFNAGMQTYNNIVDYSIDFTRFNERPLV